MIGSKFWPSIADEDEMLHNLGRAILCRKSALMASSGQLYLVTGASMATRVQPYLLADDLNPPSGT